jgi:hypothetical protein
MKLPTMLVPLDEEDLATLLVGLRSPECEHSPSLVAQLQRAQDELRVKASVPPPDPPPPGWKPWLK